MSPANPRFIVHDSKGFEAGSKVNWDRDLDLLANIDLLSCDPKNSVATFTQGIERSVTDSSCSSLTERSTESDTFLSASSLFCLSCLKLCHEQIILREDRDDGDVDTDDEPPINRQSTLTFFWQVPAALVTRLQ